MENNRTKSILIMGANPSTFAKGQADHPLNNDASDVGVPVEVIQPKKIDEISLKKDKFKNTRRQFGVSVVDKYAANCPDKLGKCMKLESG